TLAVAQASRVDCSNGGTTITLAGGGASYLVVPQFATDAVADQWVSYSMASGTITAAASAQRLPLAPPSLGVQAVSGLGRMHRNAIQAKTDAMFRARMHAKFRSGGGAALRAQWQVNPAIKRQTVVAPPAVGSTRSFSVLSSFGSTTSSSQYT